MSAEMEELQARLNGALQAESACRRERDEARRDRDNAKHDLEVVMHAAIDKMQALETGQRVALAAAQANVARLRAALKALIDNEDVENIGPTTLLNNADAALAAPAGDDALREFGVRVATQARKVHATFGGSQVDAAAIVDAVLRGEP